MPGQNERHQKLLNLYVNDFGLSKRKELIRVLSMRAHLSVLIRPYMEALKDISMWGTLETAHSTALDMMVVRR